jgi:hypothetical protein
MIDAPQTSTLQVELLAREIVARLKDAEPGHCARVDFLDRAEAQRICHYISQQQLVPGIVFHILVSNEAPVENNALSSLQRIRLLSFVIVSSSLFVCLSPLIS